MAIARQTAIPALCWVTRDRLQAPGHTWGSGEQDSAERSPGRGPDLSRAPCATGRSV